MTMFPITLLVLAAAGLGTWLFLQYLRGEARQPILIGTHLLLGAAALEQLAVLFRGAPNGDRLPSESLGQTVGFLLVVAMMLGFAAPLLRKSLSTAHTALIAHVSVAAAGCLLFLVWISRM